LTWLESGLFRDVEKKKVECGLVQLQGQAQDNLSHSTRLVEQTK
jgi:hypothetical protein